MDNSHFKTLFDVEQAIGKLITKAKQEKLYLEKKLAELSDFQSATRNVDGLPEGAFDGVQILIEQLTAEIESRTQLINKYSEELKETILDYFKNYLSNVDLSTELKVMADKYGFIKDKNQLNPDQSQLLTDLMKIERMFDNDVEKFQNLHTKLNEQKGNLLEYKEGLIAVNCPELRADIEMVDGQIRDVDENIQHVQEQTDNLKNIINTEILGYSKRFISSSAMTPEIAEYLQKFGITSFTLANSSIIGALKRTATEPPESAVQPKKAVGEQIPVVVDVPVPGNPVEECESHLKQICIEFYKKLEQYNRNHLELHAEFVEAQEGDLGDLDYYYRRLFTTEQIIFRRSVNIKNKIKSAKSHVLVAGIKHTLQMIDYVENTLTGDQLTNELLDFLNHNSVFPKFPTKPVTSPLEKQIADLKMLIETQNDITELCNEITESIENDTNFIEREVENGNEGRVELYKKMLFGKEEELKETMEELKTERMRYAEKYYAPELRDDFVKNADLPTLLAQLIANPGDVANEKTPVDRLKEMRQDLEKEYDRAISSIQSNSSSFNFDGLFDTFDDPQKVAEEEGGTSDEDANVEQEDNQAQ